MIVGCLPSQWAMRTIHISRKCCGLCSPTDKVLRLKDWLLNKHASHGGAVFDTYTQLKRRVELYFELEIHIFVAAKHNTDVCSRCFCPEEHPLHSKE